MPLIDTAEGPLTGIAFGGGRFCAVGARGLIFVSGDGLRWERVRSAIRDDFRQVFYQPGWDDTGKPRGCFVAVGAGGALYGDQGRGEWKTLVPSPTGRFMRLYRSSGRFTGTLLDSGVILGSATGVEGDPQTWSRSYARTNSTLAAACAGPGRFVMVGAGGGIVSIDDSALSAYTFAFAPRETPVRADLRDVAWAGDRFVAVGDSGVVLASPDGERWEREPSGVSGTIRAVAAGKGICIALTDGGLLARRAAPMADPDSARTDDSLAAGIWMSPESLAFRVAWVAPDRDTGRVSPLIAPSAEDWIPRLPGLPPRGDRPEDFVPPGWAFFSLDSGDLDGDPRPDYAFLLDRTSEADRESGPEEGTPLQDPSRILGIALAEADGKGLRLLLQCDTCITPRYDERSGRDIYEGGGPFIGKGILTIRSSSKSGSGWEDLTEEYEFAFRDGAFRPASGTRTCYHTESDEYEKRTLDYSTGILRLEKGKGMPDNGQGAPVTALDTLPIPEAEGFGNMGDEW